MKRLFLILSIFLMHQTGCKKTELQTIETAVSNNAEFNVEEAKEWFNQNHGNKSRIADETKRTWNWKNAIKHNFKRKNKNFQAIIIPTLIKNEKSILEDASLWIVKDEEGNVQSKFVELYNNSTANLMKKNKDKDRQQQKNFTGYLTFFDTKSSDFENGLFIQNGKVSGILFEFDGQKNKDKQESKKGRINGCYSVYTCPSNTTKTSYVHNGTVVIVGNSCSYQMICDSPSSFGFIDIGSDAEYWDYYWNFIHSNSITDSFTNPCFSSVLTDLTTTQVMDNQVIDILRNFNNTDYVKLVYTNDNIGACGYDRNLQGNTVKLNSNLNNASKEFIAVTILHETLHAHLKGKIETMTLQGDHTHITNNYINPLADAIKLIYPNIPWGDAYALAWGGLELTNAWRLKSSLNPTEANNILLINQKYRNCNKEYGNGKGTPC